MILNKIDVFEELDMGEYIWGNAYLYSITAVDLTIESNRFLVLDKICNTHNWKALGNSWKPKTFLECSELLKDAIEFDIAYSKARITPPKAADEFHNVLLSKFKAEDTCCYSNWVNNHWRFTENGSSWIALTENTFDLSTVFINQKNILITCFRSED